MERESKTSSFGFSWADEVEREEREEDLNAGRQVCLQEKSGTKPNPFGAARPREVVLEEKGVDWRKLDLELDRHSNLRKDKSKENVSTTTASNSRRHNHPYLGGRLKPETHQIAHPVISPLMSQARRARKPPRPDTGFDYPHENEYPCNLGINYMMHNRPLYVSYGAPMTAAHNYNMETVLSCKRKSFGERLIDAREEMEARQRGRFLVNLNMENILEGSRGRNYVPEQGNGRRRVIVDRRMEKPNLVEECVNGEGYYWRPPDGWMPVQQYYGVDTSLRSDSGVDGYGGRRDFSEREVMSDHRARRDLVCMMVGASSGNDFSKKSMVPPSSLKTNASYRRGRGKKT